MLTALMNETAAEQLDGELLPLDRLLRTLMLVLSLQLLGYAFVRSEIMPHDKQAGMGWFVANIALPSLLFRSIATLDVSVLNPAIVGAVVVAKVVTFGLASALGWALTNRAEPPGVALVNGGVFSLCTTMSDDVGLGYPLLSALFPKEAELLFILSALQAGLFNTVAFVLLGIGKARSAGPVSASQQPAAQSTCAIVLGVLGNLRKNFIIVSVVVGGLWRLIIGPLLPWFVEHFTSTAGAAFTPLVLYLAGAASVGTFSQLATLQSAVLPATLAALQSLLLPVLCKVFTAALGGSDQAQAFAFVYGILPCANSALVISASYRLSPKLLSVVASYLALGKIVAFPYLVLAAVSLQLTQMAVSDDAEERARGAADVVSMRQDMSSHMLYLSVLGAVWFAAAATLTPVYRRCPLRRVVALVVLQGAFTALHLAPLPTARIGRIVLSAAVAWLRWSIDGFVCVMAVDAARKAYALRDAPTHGHVEACARPGRLDAQLASDRRVDLGIPMHVMVAFCFGGAMALPFAGACHMPDEPCLLLFLPYDGTCGFVQRLIYVVAYAIQALLLAGSLGTVVLASRLRSSRGRALSFLPSRKLSIEGLATPPAAAAGAPSPPPSPPPPESDATQRVGHHKSWLGSAVTNADAAAFACKRVGFKLRVRFTVALFLLRHIFSMALVASMLNVPTSSERGVVDECESFAGAGGGSFALLLLVLVMLVDGQGIIMCLLFGFEPELLGTVAAFFARIRKSLTGSTAICRACCVPDVVRGEGSMNSGLLLGIGLPSMDDGLASERGNDDDVRAVVRT